MPVFQCLAITNKVVTSTASEECIFVSNGPKPEKVLEDKEVWDDIVRLADHLESYHLTNYVGSQHLDATSIVAEELLLEISQRKEETSVERFQIKSDLPRRR